MTPLDGRSKGDGVDLDCVFSALSHAARRRLLIALTNENPRRIHELPLEGSVGETEVIDLYHRHLPQLDEAEFIDWDRETGRITRGREFDAILPFLDFLADRRMDSGV